MTRQNVVVLLCDQLRPDFLPAYGCDAVPTPNLDRLVERGCVFDEAITQSTVCAPARATMMTGRYVSDHGVWTNDVPFRDGLEYLPGRLNDAGYATGVFGQLHHHPPEDTKGFQEAAQMEEGRLGEDEPYVQWLKERHPDVDAFSPSSEGYEFPFDETEYYEHWIASRAIDFLERQAGGDEPFLAWVAFQGPHGPLDPPSEVKGTVDTERLPEPLERPASDDDPPVVRYRRARAPPSDDRTETMRQRTAYAELIVEIDRQIGRVLDRLEELRVFEETTIIFASDHGDLRGDFGLNAKGPFPYRGQLDIPLIVANHPAVSAGTRSDALVGNVDIPGTCLDIAGGEPIGVSRSLLDQAGPEPEHEREVVFSEFCDSVKTVDDGRYRYSYHPFTGAAELYDRREDPDERRNLAGDPEYAGVERRLLMHLVDFGVVARGVRVEAKDFVPAQQTGVEAKHPHFRREFPVAHVVPDSDIERIEEAGLDPDYNDDFRSDDEAN